jgi:polyisoprenoid-binding protein YceI
MQRFVLLGMSLMLIGLVAACDLGSLTTPDPTPTPQTLAPTPTAAAQAAPTATPRPTTQPANTPAPAAQATPSAPTTSGDLVRIVFVAGKNEARYRVREQLAGVSLPSDAVGATKEVSGTIVARMDGTILSEQSKIMVDLRTLKSDDNRRDNFLRMDTLNTNRFPFAVFVVKEAKGLVAPPKPGPVEFKLVGDLTIRDVTRSITWDVKGAITGDEATGQAKTSFTFAEFNLRQPRVPLVLSVEDNIRLEIDLHVQRAAR